MVTDVVFHHLLQYKVSVESNSMCAGANPGFSKGGGGGRGRVTPSVAVNHQAVEGISSWVAHLSSHLPSCSCPKGGICVSYKTNIYLDYCKFNSFILYIKTNCNSKLDGTVVENTIMFSNFTTGGMVVQRVSHEMGWGGEGFPWTPPPPSPNPPLSKAAS